MVDLHFYVLLIRSLGLFCKITATNSQSLLSESLGVPQGAQAGQGHGA